MGACVAGDTATQFASGGFVVLPGLLSADRLALVRHAVGQAIASPSGPSCERPNNTLVPLRWNDPAVQVALDSAERVARAIDARDLRWISGYVSVKEAQSPPLWWHQDWWAWNHPITWQREAAQIAVLCYLTDTDRVTGALRVLPGTHIGSNPLHALLPEAHSDSATALDLEHPAMADQPGQVTLSLRAGDAVITDYRLLHGTHPHFGTRRRDCLLLSFTPNWSHLPEEVRAHLIAHPALPSPGEPNSPGLIAGLLPTFDGPSRDLPLSRHAPAHF